MWRREGDDARASALDRAWPTALWWVVIGYALMRLGVIGPSHGSRSALRRRAMFLLDALQAERVVYLGNDNALDEVVRAWAEELVGGDPSDGAVWARAARTCCRGSSQQIDQFLESERRRERLRALECLPHSTARTVEIFEGLVSVIIYDKALLDEEDILPASILVFGRSQEPLVHRVGPRTFISPGPVEHPRGGAALLRDENGEVTVSIYGIDGVCSFRETAGALAISGAKLTVQGKSTP